MSKSEGYETNDNDYESYALLESEGYETNDNDYESYVAGYEAQQEYDDKYAMDETNYGNHPCLSVFYFVFFLRM